MKSMTGYGSAQGQSKFSNLEVSIRTVNGRFLETRFHLPREFIFLEAELKKILSAKLRRGTVDVFVSRKFLTEKSAVQVKVNQGLAQQWLKAYESLGRAVGLKSNLDLYALARVPDIIHYEEDQGSVQQDAKALLKLFTKACDACDKERAREGASLNKELLSIVNSLEEQVRALIKLRAEANSELKNRYEQKIKARLEREFDSHRVAQEIAIMLEKADIDEELVRLKEHLHNYKNLLKSSQAEGKKIDFYTQELLREVNTIGSKSQVAKLTEAVVLAKTNIEKLREQVQNIE